MEKGSVFVNGEKTKKSFNKIWLIYIVVAAVIVLCSMVICIFDLRNFHDDFGLYKPLMHLVLFVIFFFVAVFLKMFLTKKISFLLLVVVIIVSVMFSAGIFGSAFQRGGFMYPLVKYGGPLHFFVIGDYNFDGISDIGVYPLEERITKQIKYNVPYSSEASVFIKEMVFDTTVQSKNGTVGNIYDSSESNLIVFALEDDVYHVSSLDITVYLQEILMNTNYPDKIRFYTSNENGDKLNFISSRKISSTCFKLNLRDSFMDSFRDTHKIYLRYEVEDA